ncbi:hypothetical protein BpHYR1_028154, partial [Brachionus plicatilis]
MYNKLHFAQLKHIIRKFKKKNKNAFRTNSIISFHLSNSQLLSKFFLDTIDEKCKKFVYSKWYPLNSSSSWMTASCRMAPAREPESYEQPVLWSSILFLKELTLGASMTES